MWKAPQRGQGPGHVQFPELPDGSRQQLVTGFQQSRCRRRAQKPHCHPKKRVHPGAMMDAVGEARWEVHLTAAAECSHFANFMYKQRRNKPSKPFIDHVLRNTYHDSGYIPGHERGAVAVPLLRRIAAPHPAVVEQADLDRATGMRAAIWLRAACARLS